MKLKSLPWLLAAALLIGIIGLFASNQKKAAEIAQLQQATQELEQLRAAQAGANQAPAATNDELTLLRQENKDLLRLRNEVRRLKEENQQLNRQAQSAQSQAQTAQAQAEAFRTTAAQATAQAQQVESASRMQAQANACISNLRQIEAAKQQWALQYGKLSVTPVNAGDILPYFKGSAFP